MKKLLLILVVGFSAVVWISHGVLNAQATSQDLGLAIRPAILDLPTDPGDTVSATITVQNISGGAVGVEVNAQSLIPNDATIDQEKRKETDASTWMINKGQKLVFEKDQIKEVDVQFLVPDGSSPGTHSALVTFTTTTNNRLDDTTGSVVTPVVSSLALINVSGDIVEEASVGDLNLPFLIFGKNQQLNFDISNTGNVHILPISTIKLYDHSNNLVENVQIPPQLVLPNTIKNYIAEWTNQGRVGLHRIEVDVAYGTPTKYLTIRSGNIFLMPDPLNLIFITTIIIAGLMSILYIFKGPLKRALNKIRSVSYKFRIKNTDKKKASNKPEDIARLSMDPDKIDELLSSGGNVVKPRENTSPKTKPKRKKINIL